MHFIYIVTYLGNIWVIEQFNDFLVVCIEKDVAASIDNKVIVQQFQNIKTCERKFKNFKNLSVFFFGVMSMRNIL